MCKSILKGQNVPGTDGTYHGTDGTCPRDRRDAHQGVSRQNSLCLLFFFLSLKAQTQDRKRAQKGTKERKRALPRKIANSQVSNRLKQQGLGAPKHFNCYVASPLVFEPTSSETKVCTGDFAPPEPEFRAEFWETNFGPPNFGPEFSSQIF